jgi:hypothetical protein
VPSPSIIEGFFVYLPNRRLIICSFVRMMVVMRSLSHLRSAPSYHIDTIFFYNLFWFLVTYTLDCESHYDAISQ